MKLAEKTEGKESLNKWINYKVMFGFMYKKHIYRHYKKAKDIIELKNEILYL
jgi:hypothetical protein